jgi:hypothetical protein
VGGNSGGRHSALALSLSSLRSQTMAGFLAEVLGEFIRPENREESGEV